jgi:hypothetical protein
VKRRAFLFLVVHKIGGNPPKSYDLQAHSCMQPRRLGSASVPRLRTAVLAAYALHLLFLRALPFYEGRRRARQVLTQVRIGVFESARSRLGGALWAGLSGRDNSQSATYGNVHCAEAVVRWPFL